MLSIDLSSVYKGVVALSANFSKKLIQVTVFTRCIVKFYLGIVISTAVLFCQASAAKSPVWKVSKGDSSVYIGGTIHLLSPSDFPLPDAFQNSLSKSDNVVFETDIESVNSPQEQLKFLPIVMYQDGSTIRTRVSADTFSKLEAYSKTSGMPLAMLERFTPAGLNVTLTVMELQKLGIVGTSGVESVMSQAAKQSNKPIAWLESIDQQLEMLAKMNQLDANKVVNLTLRDIQRLSEDWPKLLQAWRSGNMDALESMAIDKMKNETPTLYQFLLVDRNQDWVQQINQMIVTPEVEFIMVGALHLAGQDSVLTLLSSQGYTINQLD